MLWDVWVMWQAVVSVAVLWSCDKQLFQWGVCANLLFQKCCCSVSGSCNKLLFNRCFVGCLSHVTSCCFRGVVVGRLGHGTTRTASGGTRRTQGWVTHPRHQGTWLMHLALGWQCTTCCLFYDSKYLRKWKRNIYIYIYINIFIYIYINIFIYIVNIQSHVTTQH